MNTPISLLAVLLVCGSASAGVVNELGNRQSLARNGRLKGVPNGIPAVENLVLEAGLENGLTAWDTSDPANPTQRFTLAGTPGVDVTYDVSASGLWAFVCRGAGGVLSVDLRTGNPMHHISKTEVSFDCRAIQKIPGSAVVVAGTHVKVIDWLQMSSPVTGYAALPLPLGKTADTMVIFGTTAHIVATDGSMIWVDLQSLVGGSIIQTSPSGNDARGHVAMYEPLAGGPAYFYVGRSTGVAMFQYSSLGSFTHLPLSSEAQVKEVTVHGMDPNAFLIITSADGVSVYLLSGTPTAPVLLAQKTFSEVHGLAFSDRMRRGPFYGETLKWVVGDGNQVRVLEYLVTPPSPPACHPVDINGNAVSETVLGGASATVGQMDMVHIPAFLRSGVAYAVPLPFQAGSTITLKCCGSSPCDYFISVFRCPGCVASANDMASTLLTADWHPGSCGPKFNVGPSGPFGMATFHKHLQPGETAVVTGTAAPVEHMVIFAAADPVPQPWCTRYVQAGPSIPIPCDCAPTRQ